MQINYDQDEGIEVPMAPLIDIVFLLLIFFLVATTLKKIEPKVPIDLPQSQAAIRTSEPDNQLVIAIDALGAVYLEGVPATNMQLHERLRQHAQSGTDRPVRLDVDRRTAFEDIIRVIEQCTFEGLTDVGFHTAETEDRS